MTTVSNEEVPVMPDVRAVQREARRITTILQWPIHLIAGVFITVVTGLWLGGRYAGKTTGAMTLIFLSFFIGATLFRKRVVRAFLGAQTPMIVRKRSHGPEGILFISGLVVGAVMGFAATNLRDIQGEGVGNVLVFSCILGGGIAATFYEWAQTRLWEFIMSLALQIVILGVLQTSLALDPRAKLIFYLFVTLHCYFFAVTFYLRWRKWVKSLPETAKIEGA